LFSLNTSDYVQHFTLIETLQYAEALRSLSYTRSNLLQMICTLSHEFPY